MKYRDLGDTGIKVSEIAFGAEFLVERPYEDTEDLIKACEANGINFVDCWMSEPDVRSHLGKAIKGNRENWIIQGHIGSTWQNNQYVRTREMDKVIPAFEDFMERFQIDTLDFGMIHYVDQLDDYNEIMNGPFIEYVRKLKEEGTIEHIGLSTHNPDIGLLAAQNPEIELLMFSINPAYDMFGSMGDIEEYRKEDAYDGQMFGLNPQRAELYETCANNGTALTVMKGFAGGNLLDSETSPFGVALTPVQCIHYCLEQKGVSSIFVGVKTVDELEESLKYCDATESEKEYAETLKNAPKHSFEGQCTYCGHCAPCASEIDIAMVNKLFDLAKNRDEVPASVMEHYNNLKYNATDCIACGDCEPRCPFNVHIVDVMLDAQDLFGF
ncbi:MULTISPECIES: aldo/keto reductase [unclassified Methanobrevibacter]|jgi:predicted aldo/keto reductase-like oxidoreductase|uniref:aldo/keto reductase n=1 Tax=unclassified Methanobrevibacter TaxID=2638681 RepID=UPI0025F8030A|nr:MULTISPECIES: aldo/keto reductase [unclassified Methanobrevibacter]MEE0942239.1 aldo/keto reductase [Methanobrevibacter sp.]